MGIYHSHVEGDGKRHLRAGGTPAPQFPGNCIGCAKPFGAGAHLIHEDGDPSDGLKGNGLWHEACHRKAYPVKPAEAPPPAVQTSAPPPATAPSTPTAPPGSPKG